MDIDVHSNVKLTSEPGVKFLIMDFSNFSITDEESDHAQGFEEGFVNRPSEAFECPICLLVMNKPVQTKCGHRFCKSCIMRVMRQGNGRCPLDDDELSESQIYPDIIAWREISMLLVHCHNWERDKCVWIGPLKELLGHLRVCLFSKVECPNNCDQRICRGNLDEHANNSCSQRIVPCAYCGERIVFRNIEEHNTGCPRFPLACPNGCSEKQILREQLNEHINNDCPLAVSSCIYRDLGCRFESLRDQMADHMRQAEGAHLTMALEKVRLMAVTIESQRVEQERIRADVNETRVQVQRILDVVQQVVKFITSKDFLFLLAMLMLIAAIWVGQVRNDFNEQVLRITEISARLSDASFVWKIDSFETLFARSKYYAAPLLSPSFYTGVPGYKMCLQIDLNGDGSGKNKHVSMFVKLMVGEFDSLLQWPFAGTITLAVMDQSMYFSQHVSYTFTADPSEPSFQRPKVNVNTGGWGFSEMISHETLRMRNYIKNDTMIVKVEVQIPRHHFEKYLM